MGFTDFLVWYYHLYRKEGFLAPGSRVSAHSQSWNLTPLLLALRWKMGGRAQLQLSSWELNEGEGQAGWAVPLALEDSWGEKCSLHIGEVSKKISATTLVPWKTSTQKQSIPPFQSCNPLKTINPQRKYREAEQQVEPSQSTQWDR